MMFLPDDQNLVLLYICQYTEDRKRTIVKRQDDGFSDEPVFDDDVEESNVLSVSVNRNLGVRVMSATPKHQLAEDVLAVLFEGKWITYRERGKNTVWIPTAKGLTYYLNYVNECGKFTIEEIAERILSKGVDLDDEPVFEEDEDVFA